MTSLGMIIDPLPPLVLQLPPLLPLPPPPPPQPQLQQPLFAVHTYQGLQFVVVQTDQGLQCVLVDAALQAVLNMSTLQLPPLVLHDVQQQLELQQVQQQAVAVVASANEDINMPPAHHELTTLTGRMPVYETRPSARTASMSSTNDTQSLGAASSSSSSSSSPRYSSTSTQGGAGSDGENRNPRSRFYGKLAPPVRSSASISLFDDEDDEGDVAEFFRSPSGGASLHAHSGGLNSAVAPRRRGRQSKDEQLAATNGLPVSAAEIAEMSLPDLQKLLKADSLTEPQRQLIRKIRRRGKNKVAARTCRQRRGAARTEHPAPYENLRVLGYSNHH